ncbi:hypothetical protein V9K67_16955 [Paraflavisolibacter sp. H34]|uniref:hypothetical protein n=1 Tax=Huijunlia imazamoxiresistens TaxID=3127457 RepID=UPI0030180674
MPYFSFMTICDFIAMPSCAQEEAVWTHQHIAERDNGTYWILLYQLETFYVELYYHREKGEIAGLRPFTGTDQLEPYLEQICLADLHLML